MSHPSPAAQAEGTEVRRLARALARIRQLAWTMLVTQQVGRLLAWVIGAVVLAAVLDYFLRTPTWMRAGLWAGGATLVLVAIWRWIRPAVAFHPSLTEVALKIERSEAGRQAGLDGVLAAGLELGAEHREEPVVRAALERFGRLRLSSVLTGARVAKVLAGFVLAIGATIALAGAFPTLAGIGAQRILAPWSGAQWPKRTAVADVTDRDPHARGSGLLLRAAVLKNVGGLGSDDTSAARVWGWYRVIVDGKEGAKRRVLMTGQNRREKVVSASGDEREGALFEYLIEPWGMTPGASGSAGVTALATTSVAELEYWFETEDDQTNPERILLVEPPAVVSAVAQVTPPEYASTSDAARRIEMGAGNTDRAAAPPLLAGSRVRMSIELNKPVPNPVGAQAGADARAAMLKATFGEAAAALLAEDAGVTFRDSRWDLEWTLRETMRLDLHVEDEYGIAGAESSFTFSVLEDRPPAAAVTVPDEDRTTLPNATIELAAEGRDDVGLAWTALEYRIARPPGGSEGAPAEASGAEIELIRVEGQRIEAEGGALPRELVATASLDLSKLDLKAGDEVWVTARAADAYAFEGATHEPSRSLPRKLRIISEDQLIEQVWSELLGVRRSAMATDEEQARLTRDAQRGGEASRMERAQAGITDRLTRDREALDRIEQRVRENGLREDTIDQVMREAKRLLDQAGKSSVKAGEAMRQAGENEQREGAPDQAKRAEAGREQDRVREDLGRLIDLLDQGQDTWSTKRAIERLLEEQRRLRDRTGKTGERTMGKEREQLTREEREQLEQIAAEQQSLAQKADEAIQQMMDTEPKLRQNDPAAADAMAQAAQQAQRQQVTQRMEQASDQVERNQTNRAQQEQERAIESMEQMLQTLQNSARNRDEVLRRKLASLIESLEALIVDQRSQLELLAGAIEKNDFTGLDRGMARLHQNTLGVLDEAAQGPRELQAVAALIQDAAGAQSNATVALRVQPINSDEAKAQEEISLEKLTEAKEEAERLDREAANRQAQRKRDELKKAYREALTEQLAIRAETEPLVEAEKNRRTRATARTLGEREAALQDLLAGIERDTKELAEAVMFSFAHRRLDAALGEAVKSLNAGDATRDVTRQQDSAARVLQQLLQALEEATKKDDEFRQHQQQQQGGQGQQGGGQMPIVPPMAEVKLLRSMQEEVANLTRDAEQASDTKAIEEAAGLQGELAKQGESLLQRLMERRRAPRPAEQAPPGAEEPKPEPVEPRNDGAE